MDRTIQPCWVALCVAVAGILLLGPGVGRVAAQAVGDNSFPLPNAWVELWEMAKAAGILGTGIMGYALWRMEKQHEEERARLDAERIKYRDDYVALTERVLPLFQQGVDAQKHLGEVLSSPRRRT